MSHDGPSADPLGIGPPDPLFEGTLEFLTRNPSEEPISIEPHIRSAQTSFSDKEQIMPITLTHDEIKQALRNYETQKEEFYLQQGVNEAIDADSMLDMQYLNPTLRRLLADYENLRESVGVFPVFNKEENIEGQYQSVYDVVQKLVCEKMQANEDYKHLWPLVVEGAEARHERWVALQAEADKFLAEQGITQDSLLPLYLESMVDERAPMIGNNYKKDLQARDCQQFILPLRINDNHYTTFVMQLQNGERKTAWIKYYDSMGEDINEEFKKLLEEFLRKLGYEGCRFENVSQPEQRDIYNCGIFASFKAIDIANENAGHPERLLPQLGAENYHDFFNRSRYFIVRALQEGGYDVQLDGDLRQQFETGAARVSSHKQAEVNALLKDILDQLQRKKPRGKKEESTECAQEEVKKHFSEEELKVEFDHLAKELQKLLDQKLRIKKPTKNDLRQIQLLVELLAGANQIELRKELEKAVNEAGQAPQPQPASVAENSASTSFWKEVMSGVGGWVKDNLPWKKLGLFAVGAGSFIFLGGLPWMGAVMSEISFLMPANPLVSVVWAAVFFAGSFQTLRFIQEKWLEKAEISKSPATQAPTTSSQPPAPPAASSAPKQNENERVEQEAKVREETEARVASAPSEPAQAITPAYKKNASAAPKTNGVHEKKQKAKKSSQPQSQPQKEKGATPIEEIKDTRRRSTRSKIK